MDVAAIQRYRCARIGALIAMAITPAIVIGEPSSRVEVGEDHRPVNAICPVMTDEAVDPRFTVKHEGMMIGFCCRKCVTRFRADPAAYRVTLAALGAPPEDSSDPPEAPPSLSGEDDHDRPHAAADAPDPGGPTRPPDVVHRSRLVEWVGRFHPATMHMPIGLLCGAVIAEIGVILTRRDLYRHAAAFCLALAAVLAVIAAALGWCAGGFVLWDGDWVQAVHRWLGTGTVVLLFATLVAFAPANRAQASRGALRRYRVCLFVTAGVVSVTGFFGGALVYGIDHYAW